MSTIRSLVRVMQLRGADALIIESGRAPLLRRQGNLEPLTTGALSDEDFWEFMAGLPQCPPNYRALPQLRLAFETPDATLHAVLNRTAAGLKLQLLTRAAGPAAQSVGTTATHAAPATPHDVRHPDNFANAEHTAATSAAYVGEDHDASHHSSASPPPPSNQKSAAPTATTLLTVPPVGPRAAPLQRAHEALAELSHALAPAVALAAHARASDLLVSTAGDIRFRCNGQLRLPPEDHAPIANFAAMTAQLLGAVHQCDVALTVAGQRMRANFFRHQQGYSAALRLIVDHVPSLEELRLPSELRNISTQRDGLVLFCGPTGSGKSTTMAALVQELDRIRPAHIITLEDPIEYLFTQMQGMVHQREIGVHCESFAAGLRAALRESPDVIAVGELRDRETMAAALTAASTGHLVMASMHAPNLGVAIDRIVDAFGEAQAKFIRQQLAMVLRAVVTQYLLPRAQGGRVAAIEYVPVTAAISNVIRKGELQTLPTLISSGRESGMLALERSLARLVDSGQVSRADALRVSADQELLRALL